MSKVILYTNHQDWCVLALNGKELRRGHSQEEAYEALLHELNIEVEEREVEFSNGWESLHDLEEIWETQ